MKAPAPKAGRDPKGTIQTNHKTIGKEGLCLYLRGGLYKSLYRTFASVPKSLPLTKVYRGDMLILGVTADRCQKHKPTNGFQSLLAGAERTSSEQSGAGDRGSGPDFGRMLTGKYQNWSSGRAGRMADLMLPHQKSTDIQPKLAVRHGRPDGRPDSSPLEPKLAVRPGRPDGRLDSFPLEFGRHSA